MQKMELEVKILDINTLEFRKKLESLGAKLKNETKQILYTYDLPTIYARYIDILEQFKSANNSIKKETVLAKYKLWAFEIDNLLNEDDKKILLNFTSCSSFQDIIQEDNFLDILNNKKLIGFIKKFKNNNNKWIRLRETNGRVTIAVKHILAPNASLLQQMRETEIEVPSLEEANKLLEALGYSYKSYQEKRRISYTLLDHEIDIDSWPGIPDYFEVEGKDEEDLKGFLKILGYDIKDTVSCTADQVYMMYGKSMFLDRELKFEEEKRS